MRLKRTKIISINDSHNETEVQVSGWVRTKRQSKNVSFVSLNDGSTINNLQIVFEMSDFTESFIDEYTMVLDDNGKPAGLALEKTNNWFGRPSMSVASQQTLESNQFSISVYHQNYKHSDKVTTTLYKAMISLRSGSFSGSVDGYYKDGKYLFVSTANLTGKCFGLEKYIKSLNEK